MKERKKRNKTNKPMLFEAFK